MQNEPKRTSIEGLRFILYLVILSSLSHLLACARQSNEGVISKASVEDFGARPLLDELGLEVFRYDLKGPTNHKASIWVETWKEGQLVPDLTYGFYRRGHTVEGSVQFSILRGASPEKIRWRLELLGMSTKKWLEDPFGGSTMSGSTWTEPYEMWTGPWKIKVGETCTFLVLWYGTETGPIIHAGYPTAIDEYKKVFGVVLLRARFDAMAENELEDICCGTFSGPPPSDSQKQ